MKTHRRVARREFLRLGAAASVAATAAAGQTAVRAQDTGPLRVRRVVTGHDAAGRSRVVIDEPARAGQPGRENMQSTLIWSTGSFPADNTTAEDGGDRVVGTADSRGTVFRVVKYFPGVAPRNHRTDSIDYAVVISGSIEMELDEQTVELRQGDVLVQRGTIHNWVNRGTEPCVIAFCLIAAHAVEVGGRTLEAVG